MDSSSSAVRIPSAKRGMASRWPRTPPPRPRSWIDTASAPRLAHTAAALVFGDITDGCRWPSTIPARRARSGCSSPAPRRFPHRASSLQRLPRRSSAAGIFLPPMFTGSARDQIASQAWRRLEPCPIAVPWRSPASVPPRSISRSTASTPTPPPLVSTGSRLPGKRLDPAQRLGGGEQFVEPAHAQQPGAAERRLVDRVRSGERAGMGPRGRARALRMAARLDDDDRLPPRAPRPAPPQRPCARSAARSSYRILARVARSSAK